MLGRLLGRMPRESLERITDMPQDRWLVGMYQHEMLPEIGCCLVAHAARVDTEDHYDGFRNGDEWVTMRWCKVKLLKEDLGLDPEDFAPEHRYDALCKRFGSPRVVRALQLRALRILLGRAGNPASIPLRTLSVRPAGWQLGSPEP